MSKKIYQYTLEGKLVKEWESIVEASKAFGCNESTIRRAVKNSHIGKRACGFTWTSHFLEFGATADQIEQIRENYKILNSTISETEEENKSILIIGDLHAPFTRKGYLEFCKKIYDKYNCDSVIFIGDILDSHFSSFHDIDPDGHSAAEELRLAKLQVKEWYKTFPKAKVCIGNHDYIPARKMFNAGVSKVWLKPISEILETPNWEYAEEFIINEVLYVHGTGRKALNRMTADLISVVQGHYHSESYIQYAVGKFKKLFAMQIGCGVDDKSYAMAYGKFFDKMHINCGVVLEEGKLPILEYMNL